MNLKNKKGQAAMEYLMTYGWALLVIVIVLALLLIILGGYMRATPQCSFQEAGFVCSEPVTPVISTSGVVSGMFQHAQGEPITISEIAIIQGQVDKDSINPGCWKTVPTTYDNLAPRRPVTFANLTNTQNTLCDPAAGTAVSDLTGGDQVRGQIWIAYNYRSDATIGFTGTRTAIATLVANVE